MLNELKKILIIVQQYIVFESNDFELIFEHVVNPSLNYLLNP
jgi:hypothetical protein